MVACIWTFWTPDRGQKNWRKKRYKKVSLLIKCYSRSLDEAFSAVLTNIRSLFCVNPEVSLEISSADEPLPTPSILANVRSLLGVGPHVYLK